LAFSLNEEHRLKAFENKLEYLGVDGTIMLNWNIKQWSMMTRTGFILNRIIEI
jgi:hypothetical protein